ncbi:hypothetical protein GH714_000943 [Hevea brasiliensis]|uniref:Germin-like protein n=1 Tax=Hevea brasiliensis TaxID=3981 RepID=A0A6A6KJA6_HEVBR|nr:hypothetical protein GH714_000943 [Hevea brasiliensis]
MIKLFVNGKFCKNPNLTVAEDFFFPGLNVPGNTGNRVGSNVTLVNVDKLFGLNTLGDVFVFPIGLIHFQFNIAKTNAVAFAGLSSQNPGVITIANAIFGPNPPINPDVLAKAFQLDNDEVNGGLNPPHIHPHATEILLVLEGTLSIGFVTSNPNRLISEVLNPVDVFVFPIGLIHFQFNIAKTNGVAIASLNSQNPGVITIANATFGSYNPSINPDILAKAFHLDKKVFNNLQVKFDGINK